MDIMQALQQLLSGNKSVSSGNINWGGNQIDPSDQLGNFINGVESTKSGGVTAGSFGNQLGDELGYNMGTAKLGMGALSSLGSMWGAYNQNKLANAQFDFQKQMANANLGNQIKSYNTALTDRANARGVMEGRDSSWAEQYVNDNKLVK